MGTFLESSSPAKKANFSCCIRELSAGSSASRKGILRHIFAERTR
jgi:hypothetical protein